jgi:hypothetical protein
VANSWASAVYGETSGTFTGVTGSVGTGTTVDVLPAAAEFTVIKTGRTYRNEYEILRASWHWDEFNEFASRFKNPKGHCIKCGHWIYEESWYKDRAYDGLAVIQIRVHKGCGGRVKDLTKKQMNIVREMEESAEIPLNQWVEE